MRICKNAKTEGYCSMGMGRGEWVGRSKCRWDLGGEIRGFGFYLERGMKELILGGFMRWEGEFEVLRRKDHYMTFLLGVIGWDREGWRF